VDCDESQQLQRLMVRDQLSQPEAQARMDAQWPLARKRLLADVLISNRSDSADLSAQLAAALSP
jgi:dephospho-CoA kinase